jgi:enoyl-CoA hydratase/carnithine racemase
MSQEAVLLEVEGPLARITLNRPEVLNAMNLAWVEALGAAVSGAASAPDVRVVVVRGAGRAFCSGIDLDMLGDQRMPGGFYEGQERAFHLLETMEKITVAALHGYCLGGGLQLAISCDIRVCSSDCQLGLPAVLEGLFPAMATLRLPRLIGLGPARRLILSGEQISSEEALHLGLIDYLVPADGFEGALAEIVQTYLTAPRPATIASKRLMSMAFDPALETVYQASLPLMADCLDSPEVEAAAQAWRRRKASAEC